MPCPRRPIVLKDLHSSTWCVLRCWIPDCSVSVHEAPCTINNKVLTAKILSLQKTDHHLTEPARCESLRPPTRAPGGGPEPPPRPQALILWARGGASGGPPPFETSAAAPAPQAPRGASGPSSARVPRGIVAAGTPLPALPARLAPPALGPHLPRPHWKAAEDGALKRPRPPCRSARPSAPGSSRRRSPLRLSGRAASAAAANRERPGLRRGRRGAAGSGATATPRWRSPLPRPGTLPPPTWSVTEELARAGREDAPGRTCETEAAAAARAQWSECSAAAAAASRRQPSAARTGGGACGGRALAGAGKRRVWKETGSRGVEPGGSGDVADAWSGGLRAVGIGGGARS